MSKSMTKTMSNLEAGDCRWPIGDPRHEDFHFCGAQKVEGRPYCIEHWQLSFIPGTQRRQGSSAHPRILQIRQAA